MLEIPNWSNIVSSVKQLQIDNPDFKANSESLANKYQDNRGLMIVDCVASKRRKYNEYVVPILLPKYILKAEDSSIKALAKTAPTWMPIMKNEPVIMQEVARKLLEYGSEKGIRDENELCKHWANNALAHKAILDIKGIGPALLQYLRMLSGANSIKIDVQVTNQLSNLGVPVEWFTPDGLLKVCENLAKEAECSLTELDQLLWHNSQKVE